MRSQFVVAASALIILPAAAFFLGSGLTRLDAHVTQTQSVPTPALQLSPAPNTTPLEAALRLPFVELYRSLQASAYSSRSERVQELTKISELRQRRPALASLFKCLAMIDPEEALTFLPQLESDPDRIKALEAIIKAAPSAATAALVRRLSNMDDAVGEYFRAKKLPDQIAFWSALDPAAAAQFVGEHPELLERVGETALLTNWAAVDPAAATAWLQGHPEFTSNEAVLNDYIYGLYQNDPAIARQYVTDNAADPRFAQFIAPVAARTFYTSPEAAETFVRGLPELEMRGRALFAIANVQMEWFSTSEKRADEYQQLAEWISKFPAEERSFGLTPLFTKWAKLESQEALHWLSSIPSEEQRTIIDTYGRIVRPEDWPKIVSVADGQLRTSFLASFARAWSGTAAEIETTAQASGLSSTEAKALRRLVAEKQP